MSSCLDVYLHPLYIAVQSPLPRISNNTPRAITNSFWMERYTSKTHIYPFEVYNARQQTSDDVSCWCLEFNPPRWGQLPISRLLINQHMSKLEGYWRLSLPLNQTKMKALQVAKHPWTLDSATKRDFPRGKKTAISGWLSGRFQSFDLYWLIFAAASPHLA